MADDFIELACEGIDKASDPNRTIHKSRRKKREQRQQAEAEAQRQTKTSTASYPSRPSASAHPSRPLSPHHSSTSSDIEEVPRSAEWKSQYADFLRMEEGRDFNAKSRNNRGTKHKSGESRSERSGREEERNRRYPDKYDDERSYGYDEDGRRDFYSQGYDTGIGNNTPAFGVYVPASNGNELRSERFTTTREDDAYHERSSRKAHRAHEPHWEERAQDRAEERRKPRGSYNSNPSNDASEISAYRSRRTQASKSETSSRPNLRRSHSSHQGNHSSNVSHSHHRSRHSRRLSTHSLTSSTSSSRDSSRSPTRRSSHRSSTKQSTSTSQKSLSQNPYLSTTPAGLGVSALGTLAGAYLGVRSGHKKKGKDPVLLGLLGAVVGGLGANVVERYVEHGNDEGTMVKDSWGDEVGGTREGVKKKIGMGGSEERRGRDEGRRDRRREEGYYY